MRTVENRRKLMKIGDRRKVNKTEDLSEFSFGQRGLCKDSIEGVARIKINGNQIFSSIWSFWGEVGTLVQTQCGGGSGELHVLARNFAVNKKTQTYLEILDFYWFSIGFSLKITYFHCFLFSFSFWLVCTFCQ